MRNLKRALSLALASVMLLGMMVVGTSAASINDFTDVDEINNKEAVAIATGLGIFDGYTDGSFGPEKAVTRAEAAVVIAKILHGSDVNPSNLAGAGKFTDVPAWAEGYVNLVSALKIIEGRGNGIFDPNATVTTVEFTTMLLKALGYYVDTETALNADWKLEVTSKANALGLYGDLELGMNAPLSREDVAALTFNTLFAQRVAYNDYRGQYVKATDRDVVVTNGTVDALNTLADNTFGLYAVEGTVIANGMTDEALSASLKSEAQTRVEFSEDIDLDQDGKFELTEEDTYDFEVETGLDMIGHSAKIYYKIVKKAPVVFAIVDQATKVEYVSYDSVSTNLAKAANALGFKKNTILDIEKADYIVNYDMDTKYGTSTWNVDTLIVISNSANYEVNYVIALDQYLDTVATIDVDEDETDIDLLDTADGRDMNIAATEVAEGELVIVTDIGRQGEIKVLEAADVVSATITKLIGKTNQGTDVTKVVADGETYTISDVVSRVAKNFTIFDRIATIGEANLVLDQFGNLIGLVSEPAAPNYAYVAQFGQRHSTTGLNTVENVWTALIYFADGTNGIYEIDMDKSDLAAATIGGVANTMQLGSENYNELDNEINKTANWANSEYLANSGLKGIYNVKVLANGKADIDFLGTDVTAAAAQNGAKLYKAHSTLIDADADNNFEYQGNVAKGTTADDVLYQNNDTVYFFVTGAYKDTNGKNTLKVSVVTGIKNVEKFTNTAGVNDPTLAGAMAIGTGIREAYADVKANGKDIFTTMLVQGVQVESDHLYYYDEGNYEVDPVDGGYTLTYNLFDAETGAATSITYDNDGKAFATVADAKALADVKPDGFYIIGAKDIKAKYTATGLTGTLGGTTDAYVVNDSASYDEIIDNLFSTSVKVGSIFDEDTVIVNLTKADLDTLKEIANVLDPTTNQTHGDVKLSYIIDKNYNVDVLFVTEFTPDGTQAPGSAASTTANYLASVTVNGVNQAVAGAYDTVAKAVANAKVIKLSSNNTAQYDINLESTNYKNGNTQAYGAAAIFGDYETARDAAVASGTSVLTGVAFSNQEISEGNYMVIAIEGDVGVYSYYAYTFVK